MRLKGEHAVLGQVMRASGVKAQQLMRAWVAVLALAAFAAHAQDYPAKPVRVIVAFPPGSIPELLTRAVTEKVGPSWGQSFIVEPRPGASGNIGAQLARSAAPDGYTLMMGGLFLATNPALDLNSRFAATDFVGVAHVGVTPNLVVVPATLPVSSLREFVEYARARPAKLMAAHAGTGTFGHLSTLLLASHAGIELVNVPYKGLPQAMPDLLSGQLSFMVATNIFALPHLRSGKLKALAVNTTARLNDMPNVPTLVEAGFPPQIVAAQWFGFVAPAGTPPAIVRRFNGEVGKALRSPDVAERLGKIGVVISESSPEQFDALIRSESERWTRVINERKLKAD
jgi:tripartite-type tricarboxylate transporter receptor subunit TctC